MGQQVRDSQTSFEGGQDSSFPPSRLPENRYSKGINLQTSKGVITPRYGYERKQLQFPEGGYSYRFNKVAEFKKIFQTGVFQALVPYNIGNAHYLIASVSGVLFLINQDTYVVRVLTLNQETQLDQTAKRINWSAAGRFVVFYDFPSAPIIVDGQVARRAKVELSELPPSNLGVYNQNRLFFSNFGNEFSAGDAVGNELLPDAPITIEEISTSGSPFFGDVYQVPSRFNSPITAMANLQSVDSSTGIGALIVATRNEIFSFNTVNPREEWLNGRFGTSINDRAGIAGARALVNINADLFFVSPDLQLRSLSAAQEEQRKWSRVPMSVEVEAWTKTLQKELAQYAALTYFKNKLFWTVKPFRTYASKLDGKRTLDVAHQGFAVLELDNISRMGSVSNPAWAGIWVGIKPLDMAVNDERMFVVSKDYESTNVFYEVDPELTEDRTSSGQRRSIKSIIYTREHVFGDLFALKDLSHVEIAVSEIEGDFNLKIEWKPSHSSKFLPWADFSHHVPTCQFEIVDGIVREQAALSFRELKFGVPDLQQGNPATQDRYEMVKRVQLKITLEGGKWQLNEYQIIASIQPTEADTELPQFLEVSEDKQCNNDLSYREFAI